jgi:EGF-like domain/Laminin EGF domain
MMAMICVAASFAACRPPAKNTFCPNSLCSEHGQCSAPEEFPSCVCDEGYSGPTCASCGSGFHPQGGGCAADERCTDDACGEHGTCSMDQGRAYCVCDDGYSSEDCSACAVGYHTGPEGVCVLDEQCLARSCSEAGTCTVEAGLVQCACDTGYTGTQCERCDDGYHRGLGDACIENESCTILDPCAHLGECQDSSGIIVCECDAGYSGTTCTDCYPGYHSDGAGCVPDTECIATSCAGNGACDGNGGVVTCTCEAGYTGSSCRECAAGYHLVTDVLTSFACAADEVCDATAPAPCMQTPSGAIRPGGLGTQCDDSSKTIVCACAEGYAGALCDSCAVGFRDDLSTAPIPFCVPKEVCLPSSCGFRSDGTTARGTCDDSTGIVVCNCDPAYDYIGTYCEQSIDNCASNACNTGTPGVCIDLDQGPSDLYGPPPLFDPTPDGKNDGDYVCLCPLGNNSGGHGCN